MLIGQDHIYEALLSEESDSNCQKNCIDQLVMFQKSAYWWQLASSIIRQCWMMNPFCEPCWNFESISRYNPKKLTEMLSKILDITGIMLNGL